MFTFAVQAQTSFKQTASNPTGAISNTSVDTMGVTLPSVYYPVVGVQVKVVKSAGTAAGTAVLYGSINGSDYTSTGDTLTLSNQTTNHGIFKLQTPHWKHYRILVGGATTVTATASAVIYPLK